MFAICDRKRLLSVFSTAAKLAPRKATRIVFKYVLIQAEPPNKLILKVTDGRTFFTRTICGITAKEPGTALLPSKPVARILRDTKDTHITLSSPNGDTTLLTDSCDYPLGRGPDVDTFPAFLRASDEAVGTRTVKAEDLARLFSRTVFATGSSFASYALDVVRLEFSQGTITGIATNGQRMAVQAIPVEVSTGEPNLRPVHVPMKSAQHLVNTIARAKGNAVITVYRQKVAFRFKPDTKSAGAHDDEVIIGAPHYPGSFPDWPRVLPKSRPTWTSTIAADALLRAVKDAKLLTRKDSNITLAFSDGQLKVSVAATNGTENTVVSILAASSVSAMDSKLSVAVKARYLTEFLRTLAAKTQVTLDIRRFGLPVILTVQDGCTYAVAQVAF